MKFFVALVRSYEGQIKKPFILRSEKDKERETLLSWYHLHSLLPHGSNLAEY